MVIMVVDVDFLVVLFIRRSSVGAGRCRVGAGGVVGTGGVIGAVVGKGEVQEGQDDEGLENTRVRKVH